ncbi:MAG: 50S ribosomal protein L24 [Alphaproteobacteria bacterium]
MADAWKIKKGDLVFVLSGKDKGKTGKILKVLRDERRVVVEGVNLSARHHRPSPRHPEGGIVRQEFPLHASNVAFFDPVSGGPTRVGFRIENGNKVRYAKRSGDLIDQ